MIVFLLLIILIDVVSSNEIQQFKIYENSSNDTLVGTIEISPSNYQMSFIDDGNSRFHWNSLDQLITNEQLRGNQHHIRIRFSKQTNAVVQKSVSIELEDINQSPSNLQCETFTGFPTAREEDLNRYEINCTNNGQSLLSVSIQLETLPDNLTLMFVPIYSWIIPVNDKIDEQTKENIVILYSNDGYKTGRRQRRQANSPPQDIYFDVFHLTVPENSRNYPIANVYVADNNRNNYTCSVYTYNVPDNQQPFEIHQGILRTSLAVDKNYYNLDYETRSVYNITITCSDPIHMFTIAKNLSVDVTNVNEGPVELRLIPNTLPENSVAGYVIGQFHTIDPDAFTENSTFQYTIITDPNHLFAIETDQLILTRDNLVEMCIFEPDLCPHDYEQKTSLYVRIRVDDNSQPPISQKFWIQIRLTDENDPPVNLQLDANFIKENSPIGTLIGSFSVQDQDLYQTHIFTVLDETSLDGNGQFFVTEDYDLRSARSPDYEQEQFILVTIQAMDNGTIPKNTSRVFLIEIVDIDELPSTYIFIPNTDSVVSNETVDGLINGKTPVRTVYLPQNAYSQSLLGRILFIMEDRDRNITLTGVNSNELGFSKPTCEVITEVPYRLLCTSIVTVANPRSIYDNEDGHLVVTPLILTSNNTTITFPKPLRIKFENISLTIDNTSIEFITIPKSNATGFQIGPIHAIDLAAGGQPVRDLILNPNSSLSYPLEMINSTLLKVRDDVNFSSFNSSLVFNVSIFVTTADEEHRMVEKYLIIHLKDKRDFHVTLSNNKTMENSHENTLVGNFIVEDGIGDYSLELIDDANGRFKLNGTSLLTAQKYIEHCHIYHSCPLNHENEPIVNITIVIIDPSTNETLRSLHFSIEVQNENEPPYNLTLTPPSVPEDTAIGSVVGLINAMDNDFNQTLTYSTDNLIFNITNNQLILTASLNRDYQQVLPLIIRASDNGHPPAFTEKLFSINVTAPNRPPINVTSSPMTVYFSLNSNSTPVIIGQLLVIDPNVDETFHITFDKANFRVSAPANDTYTIISDNGSTVYAQVYNISIEDFNPLIGDVAADYLVNVTANITDSANHSISHNFSVHYVPRTVLDSMITSTTPLVPTTTPSLAQVLHVRIYETTPSYMSIIRGLLNISLSNDASPICTAIDDETNSFPTNTTRSAFIISLPDNYTLNSTIHPTILLNVQCHLTNDTYVDQEIVIDVLPAPPTIKINFNQTRTFYVTNHDTILGTISLIESTTNRTYNLSLINSQEIFQLLANGSLLQIGPYPMNLLQMNDPHVNLTIEAIETTLNEPTRLVQTTFFIPIIINSSTPYLTFSETSIPNDTNPNTIIGNITVHNLTTPYSLQLIDTYDNGLELNSNISTITLNRPIPTFPLLNNQTQLPIHVALMNESNGTILTSTFPLTITYSTKIDLCLNPDCGNGTCIQTNESSFYCLCTGGYQGTDCRTIDSCAYNPCKNNGVCQQLSSTGDLICQCLTNYIGTLCETWIDVCQENRSLCSAKEICIPMNKNSTNFYSCISQDQLQYFVFDYLKDSKNIDVINEKDFPGQFQDFINQNLFPVDNIVLPERKILGPGKYNRAALLSVGVPPSNTTWNDTLGVFCANQSSIVDIFARKICTGYYQAIDLDQYFKSTPEFCPNCSFADAADKYYWFDKIIPFLPLWITLIVGSILMTAIPLLPFTSNAPKKVVLPLMKARMRPEDEQETNNPVLIKSVRSAVKLSRSSPRERNDSGYESTEESENYLEQIITHHSPEQPIHIYPVLHTPRSPDLERRGTTLDDLISSRNSRLINPPPRRYIQRSASVSAQRTRRQPSIGNSQTLKPIIHRRSTLFDSSIGTFLHLPGTSRLNTEDTYVSTRFRNENTSKFVIGTLWNTFALVNNLFLQRSRKRRNAISGENIQVEQLAHLQQLYSLAEQDRNEHLTNENLQSMIRESLLQPKTTNLQSIIFDILSSNNPSRCTCYGNHHISSCIYYDHSLPYIKRYLENTSELQNIFYDIQKSNQPRFHNASTQSSIEKPMRTFIHSKSTTTVATQSYAHASTQYSPRGMSSTQFNSNDHNYINIVPLMKKNETNYINAATQVTPIDNENVSTQYTVEKISPKKPISKNNDDETMYDRRNSLMNELKQAISSKTSSMHEETKRLPSHTVRSLVSIFETSQPSIEKNSNLVSRQKPIIESPVLNIPTEEIQSPIVPDTIEQYANEIASNIVDNAVLTATTTTVYHNEQLHRRFSFYNNGGGFGKSLLFQSNTFVPVDDAPAQEFDQHRPVDSQLSNAVLNDRSHPEDEPQQTLIVGRYVDGDEKPHSLPLDRKFYLESSSNDEDEQVDDPRQFLSNSQLFSAQELYIRPWLVRRATAPDIHCLDNPLADTRVEVIDSSETFFHIFPKTNYHPDFYTRFTCLITILVYLHDVHDENSNRILYDEIDRLEKQFNSPNSTPASMIHSNAFQTINPDGSKRYRTGFVVDVNDNGHPHRRKILSQQIEWKRVKVLVRRFRKKYRYYKQLMKIDQKIPSHQLHLDRYLNYFDSTAKRRIKKFARHYAEKL